jgi:hypothetical protein
MSSRHGMGIGLDMHNLLIQPQLAPSSMSAGGLCVHCGCVVLAITTDLLSDVRSRHGVLQDDAQAAKNTPFLRIAFSLNTRMCRRGSARV